MRKLQLPSIFRKKIQVFGKIPVDGKIEDECFQHLEIGFRD